MNRFELAQIPKIEQHVHIEALASDLAIYSLSRKYGILPETVEEFFSNRQSGYANIETFFESWHMLNGMLREYEDFEYVVADYLINSAAEGLKYVEININVMRQIQKGLSIKKILESVCTAQDFAFNKVGIISRTILSYSRDFSIAEGKEIVDMCIEYRHLGVVGFDIAGNEKLKPNNNYLEVYTYAKQKKVNTTAHAGEGVGGTSLAFAIDNFGVQRVGHAVDAKIDKDSFKKIIHQGIGVELCVTSNNVLGFSEIDTHIGKQLLDAGAFVTINTDDPTLFGITILDEYETIYKNWNLAVSDLYTIYLNGVTTIFADIEIKQHLLSILNKATTHKTHKQNLHLNLG